MDVGYITNSSPPIVVNGTVVVGNSHEQGYSQSRIENVPGDILAYDARSGEHRWKFNIIPQTESEFGFDTWENDAWDWTGDVSSWAPLSADLERGIVYIPTNSPTIDYYGGFRPGNNLFGTTTIAIDVESGQRVWHFQTVHHPIWNYDLPNVPILGGRHRRRPAGADGHPDHQAGDDLRLQPRDRRAGLADRGAPGARFDRAGRAAFSDPAVPDAAGPAQPARADRGRSDRPDPGAPAGSDRDPEPLPGGRTLHAAAAEQPHTETRPWNRVRRGRSQHHPPGDARIRRPATSTRRTGRAARAARCGRGAEADAAIHSCTSDSGECTTTGTTISDWVQGGGVGWAGPQGLPIYKPPFSKITAIDMNTGEHVFAVPVGEPSEQMKRHPALEGVDLSGTGAARARAILMTTGSLLLATEGTNGPPVLNAHDKRTGEKVGTVELPAPGQYGMMTFEHEGQQHIVVQIGRGGSFPGSLVALRLPEGAVGGEGH